MAVTAVAAPRTAGKGTGGGTRSGGLWLLLLLLRLILTW